MIMDKKKILIISGVSVAVLGLSLGLGLGLGLSSDDDTNQIITAEGENALFNDNGNLVITDADGKETEYTVKEEGDKKFIQYGDEGYEVSFGNPTLALPSFQAGTHETPKKLHNFDIAYAGIGTVVIPNDGKIWRIQDGKPTDFVEIAADGNAYIPLSWAGTGDDAAKEVPFRLFQLGEEIRMATNNTATSLEDIGAHGKNAADDPNGKGVETDWPGGWGDDGNKPKATPDTATLGTSSVFTARELKQKKADDSGYEDVKIDFGSTTTIKDARGKIVPRKASELYYRVQITAGGFGSITGVGSVQASPDGKVTVGGKTFQIPDKTNVATIKNVELELTESGGINEGLYGTTSNRRDDNEVYINVESAWLDYYKQTAQLDSVKNLAKEQGVTIRFKVANADDERNLISTVGVRDERSAEVFLAPSDATANFNTRNQLSPLKYTLLTELEKETSFTDSWRAGAKIEEGNDKGDYGFYPFNQEVQIIAYNTDVMGETGFDFSNGKRYDEYLAKKDFGPLADVQKKATGEADKTILASNHLVINGAAWAYDFYKDRQEGQEPNQQDVVWPATDNPSEDKDFYSDFADTDKLKDDPRFKNWVDHYQKGNEVFKGDDANSTYTKSALFNGHVGGILIGPWWLDGAWKNGTYKVDGDAAAKKAFAENKIKFQALPDTNKALTGGWYAGMVSGLSEKKQRVAEQFIFELTNPSRAEDFFKATTKFSPRSDVNLTTSDDKILASASEAIGKSKFVSRANMGYGWIWGVFTQTATAITATSTYESVAKDLKSKAESNAEVNKLRVPKAA